MRNTLFLLFASVLTYAQTILPVPVQTEKRAGMFTFGREVDFVIPPAQAEIKKYAGDLSRFIRPEGYPLVTRKGRNPAVTFALVTDEKLGREGYVLDVKQQEISLTANTPAGIFNGIQSLRQLLPAALENRQTTFSGTLTVPQCRITDYPRYQWRGLMLDVSRHFFTVEEVKSFIDRMSQYKFNVLHWHLTDDEGWRIEIKSLPRLTETGAWRVERHGRFGEGRPYPKAGEKATYGGFYTQEQIREVIRFAAERNITIVPEIDLPGHSMALLAAYPELSVKKEPKFVNPGSKFAEWYGAHEFKMLIENTLNPADENVYAFVDKVMTEVAQLFPGEYIHMGGDECYHGYWQEDAGVQEFMKKNNLKDTKELQAYFVRRVNDIIASKGKKMIGWDEILDGGGLPKSTAVMSWRGMEGGIKAAQEGHYVVMTPTTYAYLDYTQGDKSVENPIYADLSLAKSYELDPTPEGIDPKYILGGQGNLWTEVIPSLQYAYYMAYPRALAISEKLWSPKNASTFPEFLGRLESAFQRFDEAGVSISRAIYEPQVIVTRKDGAFYLELQNPFPDTDVFFSLDNTYPVIFSSKYTAPVLIPEGDLMLRTQTYRNGKALGRELIIPRTDLIKRAK